MIIAHRGASGEFPENSLLAFEQAIIQGADGIELDIQYHQTSGEFVILHDSYVEKTTNGNGHFDKHSIKRLKQLNLGQGQKLTTLPEVLSLIDGRVFVNIELKTAESCPCILNQQLVKLAEIIASAISCNNFSTNQFILSSFNHVALKQCQLQLPTYTRAALFSHCPLSIDTMIASLDVTFINPDINCLNKSMVDSAHHLGYKVLVFTVDREQDIQRCLALGVDGIFTNFPRKSRQLLNNCKL